MDHISMLKPRVQHYYFGYSIVLAVVLGASAIGYKAYATHQTIGVIADTNENLRLRQAAVPQQPGQQELELRRQWAALRDERTFPWANVFRAVEQVTDPEIELLEFRPDRRQGALLLKGEGRTAESVMRYLERLQDDTAFSRVYLVHTSSVERNHVLTRSFELHLNLNSKQFAPR